MNELSIVLDGRVLSDHFPGIGRYVVNLTRALATATPEIDICLLHDPSSHTHRLTLPNLPRAACPISPFTIRQQWIVPALLRRLRTEWGWSDKRIIGQFGFITPAKGHPLVLEALAQLPDDYGLLIAGGLRREADRPALDVVRQRIVRLNLENRVRITGYLNAVDMPAHIHACDVLIYPYTHVDSSYSVMTGLAYQTAPVIISDVYAHRELAERRAGVELFRSGDPADLRRAVQSVLNDEQRRTAMRRDTLRFAQEYSWQAIARKTREVYLRALHD